MYKKILGTILLSTLMGISLQTNAGNFGDLFRDMEKRSNRMMQQIDEFFSEKWFDNKFDDTNMEKNNNSLSENLLSIDPQEDGVMINVAVGKNEIEIETSTNQLTIELPKRNQEIFISYDKQAKTLLVTSKQSKQEEIHRDDTYGHYEVASSMRLEKSISHAPDFESSDPTYKKKKGPVTIFVPYVKEKTQIKHMAIPFSISFL